MMKTIVLAAALALTVHAQAQTASTPAKKELIAKILKAQQPGIENMARQLVEQPAMNLLQRAGMYIQARIPADKREAAVTDLQAQTRKYVDDTVPLVREKAIQLAPTTIGAVLDEKLNEEELREVLAVFESPTWRKFEALAPDMQKALGDKLVADSKDQVEPKLRALDAAFGKRLGVTAPAAASGASRGK